MSRCRGRFDLHLHTDCSDGTDSVSAVVAQVQEQGLAGFSITDHDTMAAQAEARRLAEASGLQYLSGLELSVADGDRDIHLLVYGYEQEHPELSSKLAEFRQVRHERALGMIEKLAALGYPLDTEKLVTGREAVGRPHLARALVDSKAVSSIREAFDRFLAVGQPAYLPKFKILPEEGIALGQRAGGVVVLAHPAAYPFEIRLGDLVALGLQGVETSYPTWDQSTTAFWRAEARRYALIETGGSDYHGGHRSSIRVGEATIGPEMFERLLTACKRQV